MPGPMGPPGMPPSLGAPMDKAKAAPMIMQNHASPPAPRPSAAPQPAAPQQKTLLGSAAPPAAPSHYAPYPGPRPTEVAPDGSAAVASAAYLAQLATLARELEARAGGGGDAAAIRLLRQRLTQWIEDVRSVGGSTELAGIVEELVERLSAALAAPAGLVAEALAVAAALAALAAGSPPPPAKKNSRLAFWK